MMRIVTTNFAQQGRASWKVNSSGGKNGPWVIQRAYCNRFGGHHFDPPLPEHVNFPTRKAAEEIKRGLQ